LFPLPCSFPPTPLIFFYFNPSHTLYLSCLHIRYGCSPTLRFAPKQSKSIFKKKNPASSKFVALQLQIGIAYVKTVLSKSEISLLLKAIQQHNKMALFSFHKISLLVKTTEQHKELALCSPFVQLKSVMTALLCQKTKTRCVKEDSITCMS
jgi:hypothetical protein